MRLGAKRSAAAECRHHPERYGLQLDEAGWTSLPQVLDILASLPSHQWADRSDVVDLVRHGTGDGKKRFEIEGDPERGIYLSEPIPPAFLDLPEKKRP